MSAVPYDSTSSTQQNHLINDYLSKNPGIDANTVSFVPRAEKKTLISKHALLQESVGTQRGILNWIPFIIGITLPWLLFNFSLGINSFRLRDWFPMIVDIVNLLCILTAVLHISTTRRKRYDVKCIIGILCLMYLVAGWVIGSLLYWYFMQPFYTLSGMATYHGVNPSRFKKLVMSQKTGQIGEEGYSSVNEGENYEFALEDAGHPTYSQRYQDAGIVYFDTSTVTIDRSKTVSYKEGDLYCVAPIVDTACKSQCGFEFWAVGLNCCGTDGEVDFTCDTQQNVGNMFDLTGLVHGSPMRSAIRWIGDPLAMNFFRLATTEAEGIHKIEAKRPTFYKFYGHGEDPVQEVANLARSAWSGVFALSIGCFMSNILFMGYLAKKMVCK